MVNALEGGAELEEGEFKAFLQGEFSFEVDGGVLEKLEDFVDPTHSYFTPKRRSNCPPRTPLSSATQQQRRPTSVS